MTDNKKSGKEIAVITMHGMGKEDPDYYKGFKGRLREKLGKHWKRVAFGHIYYQDKLDPNEKFVYERMKRAKTAFRSFILWRALREFFIFYFADPGSLENNKREPTSAYYQTQVEIANELRRIYKLLGRDKEKKVFIIAHSLGGQVISSYIWDKQYASASRKSKKRTQVGIWGKEGRTVTTNEDEDDFLSLESLHRFYTCGCNIPLFVAGHDHIIPIKKPNDDFKWLNYYSKNDVLGWPLQPLRGRKSLKDPQYRNHPTYATLVEDHEIRVGAWWQFWNPLSHKGYLTDDTFLDPIVKDIESSDRASCQSSKKIADIFSRHYGENMATVRYLVNDVNTSIEFYTKHLGFELVEQMGLAFALIAKGDLNLWLSGPGYSAARPMPDGRKPEAGGWNRFVIEVQDIESVVASMTSAGILFRNDIVSGPGGKQIVAEDPSGNPIEIFQPA